MSPALYPLYREPENITVVVDILRATSAICTALHHGVSAVIPVASVDDAHRYTGPQYIHAAERGGEVVGGFFYGNSPLTYINNPEIVGKELVLTTTNGTQAIEAAKDGGPLCIGAFSNITALCKWLLGQQKDIMVLCSGWKNRINLEDTIFAGALVDYMLHNGYGMDIDSDAAITARLLYTSSREDIHGFLAHSSHRNRLHKLQLDDDVHYCLEWDTTTAVPVLQGHRLLKA